MFLIEYIDIEIQEERNLMRGDGGDAEKTTLILSRPRIDRKIFIDAEQERESAVVRCIDLPEDGAATVCPYQVARI